MVLGILLASSAGAMAQGAATPGKASGLVEIQVQFTRARDLADLNRLCRGAVLDASGRACSYAVGDPAQGTCVIVALEPQSFNDMPRLVAFGREIMDCLASRGTAMAAAARR
jgi:hypothetical protein